jgi:PKD repeat protein
MHVYSSPCTNKPTLVPGKCFLCHVFFFITSETSNKNEEHLLHETGYCGRGFEMKKHLLLILMGCLSLSVLLSGCIENRPPLVNIVAVPAVGVAPLSVSFIGNATDEDGTIDSYLWNFGDGNTSQEQNPTHVFTDADTYNVSLTVTDNNGVSATAYLLVSLVPPQIVFQPVAEADTAETSNETFLYCEKYVFMNDSEIPTVSHEEIYLKFDLSSIPEGIQVDSATLMLFLTDIGFYEKQGYEKGVSYPRFGNSGNLFIGVYRCDNTSWVSSELNFSNAPAFNRTPVDVQQVISYEGSGENTWISWNITSLLRRMVSDAEKQVTLVVNVEPDPTQVGVPTTYGYASFCSTYAAIAQGNEYYPTLLMNFSKG